MMGHILDFFSFSLSLPLSVDNPRVGSRQKCKHRWTLDRTARLNELFVGYQPWTVGRRQVGQHKSPYHGTQDSIGSFMVLDQ